MSREMDAILEVGHTVFIKQELIVSDESSAFKMESTDLASQPAKSENSCPSIHDVGSPGQSQMNSSSTPVNTFTRVKTEEYLEESHSVDSSDIRTEIKLEVPEHLFTYENVRETNGTGDDAEVEIFSPVDPLSTTNIESGKNKNDSILDKYNGEISRGELVPEGAAAPEQFPGDSVPSRVYSLTEIKTDLDDKEDKLVSTLHTGIDIKNEVCGSEDDYKGGINIAAKFSSTVAIRKRMNYNHLVHNRLETVTGSESKADDGADQQISTGNNNDQNLASRKNKIEKKGNFEAHIRLHTGQKPFSCNHCSASYAKKNTLNRHILTHTGEKPFSCSHCSASFAQKFTLKMHILTHTGEKPFRCRDCSASFTTKNSLVIHMRTHTGEKPFRCRDCSASFTTKNSLLIHMRTHTGEKPFSCTHCSVTFAVKRNLNAHMLMHTGDRPFGCSHCSASFASTSTLKTHIRLHTGEKPFRCSNCSASFTHKNSLVRHMRLHTGEKPFRCRDCSTSFNSKNSLVIHMRTHTGEKPFSCTHCSVTFAVKRNLNAHMLMHTGERPFSCSHCSASFASKSTLKTHIRLHTGEKPFRCSKCSASFARKNSLVAHMRSLTGEKPFSCSHCPSLSPRKGM